MDRGMLSETFGPCHRAKRIYEAFRMRERHHYRGLVQVGTYLTEPAVDTGRRIYF
jgi:hypothetical protein